MALIGPRQAGKMTLTRRVSQESADTVHIFNLELPTNLVITDRMPEEYFPKIEAAHPGTLASQWIPQDPELWKIENTLKFLKARQELLAKELNERMKLLLHGDEKWVEELEDEDTEDKHHDEKKVPAEIVGGIADEEEEQQLEEVNAWVESKGLAPGELSYDLADEETGRQLAVLDLVWSQGVQAELTQPVAVLLNEPSETLAIANEAGFRCFTTVEGFKNYVEKEIFAED